MSEDAPAPAPAPAPDPEINALSNAITRGDFRDAQDVARRLLARDDEASREAGRVGLERFQPDSTIIGVFVLTGALIALLAAMYLGAR